MRPLENDAFQKILSDWLNKATLDLKSAQALLSHDPPLLYPACFHCQQAAEKYLKAFLTLKQIEFPKTHIIEELLDLIYTVDEGLAARLATAARLTPYGVDIRYPADQREPGAEQAREAMELAALVRDSIMPIVQRHF